MLDSSKAALRGAAAGLILVALSGTPAAAQVPPVPGPAAAPTQHPPAFLTRSDFSFLGARFITSDPRFTYDARLTADLDLLDYRAGRTNLLVDYEAVIGSERRRFDVNHGNYSIALSTSYRAGPVEVSTFFHHVSRHLSDRSNPEAISWNVIGARAARRITFHGSTIDATFDAGRAMQTAFVDYTWMTNLHLMMRRPVGPRASVFVSAAGGFIGVDHSKDNRSRQCGARGEFGLHLDGEKGAAEVFLGYERRADAFPTDRVNVRFFTIGFRLMTK